MVIARARIRHLLGRDLDISSEHLLKCRLDGERDATREKKPRAATTWNAYLNQYASEGIRKADMQKHVRRYRNLSDEEWAELERMVQRAPHMKKSSSDTRSATSPPKPPPSACTHRNAAMRSSSA